MGGHHRGYEGATDDWITPPGIIEALGPFDLDPCASVMQPWPTAHRHLTIEDDGLRAPWDGFVWLNPPYGPHIWPWLGRLACHPPGGIALIFARTETRGFFRHVWRRASSVMFLEGRLHFHHVDGSRAKANAGAPSALGAYGPTAVARLGASGIAGAHVKLSRRGA